MGRGGPAAARDRPAEPGELPYPPRCLLSIRFFCLTGCKGMLSVMAAAAGLGAAASGEERRGGSDSQQLGLPRSAQPLPPRSARVAAEDRAGGRAGGGWATRR